MRIRIILSGILLLCFLSCSKDNYIHKPPSKIEGIWIGTYNFDGHPDFGNQYFSFIIKPDKTMIADTKGANQQHIAIGTWSLTGNTLSCEFTYVDGIPTNIGVSQTATATFDNTGKLTGTWQNEASTGSGNFVLTRVD